MVCLGFMLANATSFVNTIMTVLFVINDFYRFYFDYFLLFYVMLLKMIETTLHCAIQHNTIAARLIYLVYLNLSSITNQNILRLFIYFEMTQLSSSQASICCHPRN